MMLRCILLAAALMAAAAPAHAGPVGALIGAAVAAVTAGGAVTAFVVRIGLSVALSALANVLRPQQEAPEVHRPGIRTETTGTGGDSPQTFILGRYATAGHLMAPPYSHPNTGDHPNRFLTYVVSLSDAPGVTLRRLIVAGEYVDLTTAPPEEIHALHGMIKDGHPRVRVTPYDGTQAAVDPYMIYAYASDPERPWQTDMIGTGVSYAVVTFRYDREVFNSLPSVRFEVDGIALYDPRADDTVGGTGPQRWADPATWAQTDNPIVMVYNILRGIRLPDGRTWGGNVAAANLPLSTWFSAMNDCDAPIALAAGGSEPQYRAGFEVSVDMEPAEVIEALLAACSAQIAEFGGVYTVRVGPPALPVFFFSDDDIIATAPQSLVPYPGLDSVHNAITASHPDPDSLWESVAAPPRYDAQWEAEDGNRQLVAHVDLPAVWSGTQAQRLMTAWIRDARRFRRHELTLPRSAAILTPLDCVAWTSAEEGYTAKVFEVSEISDDLVTAEQTLSLRERDASDFDWTPGTDEVSVFVPSGTPTPIAPREVVGWSVAPASVADDAGILRRPALQMSWDIDIADDARGLFFEVRPVGRTELAVSGSVLDLAAGSIIVSDGIVPGSQYEARARLMGGSRATVWTGWVAATAPLVYFSEADFDAAMQAKLAALDTLDADLAAAEADIAAAEADITTLQSEMAQAQSDITAAEADVAQAQADVAQAQADVAAAQADVAQAQADITAAEAAVALAQSDVAQAQQDVAAAQIDILTLGDGTNRADGLNPNSLTMPVWESGQLLPYMTVAQKDTGAFWAQKQNAPTEFFYEISGSTGWMGAHGYEIPVTEGDEVAIGFTAAIRYVGDVTKIVGQIRWYQADGSFTSVSLEADGTTDLGPTWATFFNKYTAPAGTVSAKPVFAVQDQTGFVWLTKLVFARTADADVVVRDGSIYAWHVAANTLTAAQIQAGTITATEIAVDAITSAKILAGAITATKIATRTILATNIKANEITANEIKAGTITASEIAADAITSAKIIAGAVTATEIATRTILATNIKGGEITAFEIKAGTITATEIATRTITANQIKAGTITANEIAANTITANEILAGSLTALEIAVGTITADRIVANTIEAAQIKSDALTNNSYSFTAGTITRNNNQSSAVVLQSHTFTHHTTGPALLSWSFEMAESPYTSGNATYESMPVVYFLVDGVQDGGYTLIPRHEILNDGTTYFEMTGSHYVRSLSVGSHTVEIKYDQLHPSSGSPENFDRKIKNRILGVAANMRR